MRRQLLWGSLCLLFAVSHGKPTKPPKFQVEFIYPAAGEIRVYGEENPLEVVVAANVSGFEGNVTIEVIANDVVLQGSHTFTRKSGSVVWLACHDVASYLELGEAYSGALVLEAVVVRWPKKETSAKREIQLRHITALDVEGIRPHTLAPRSGIFNHSGARAPAWPKFATPASAMSMLSIQGATTYIETLVAYSSRVAEEKGAWEGRALLREAMGLQLLREEQKIQFAALDLSSQLEVANDTVSMTRDKEITLLREQIQRLFLPPNITNTTDDSDVTNSTQDSDSERERDDGANEEGEDDVMEGDVVVCITGNVSASAAQRRSLVDAVHALRRQTSGVVDVVLVVSDSVHVADLQRQLSPVNLQTLPPDYEEDDWRSIATTSPLSNLADVNASSPIPTGVPVLRELRDVRWCHELRAEYEATRRDGKPYDWEVRLQGHLIFPVNLPPLSSYVSSAVSVASRHAWGGLNRRWAVGPVGLMDAFGAMYDRIDEVVGPLPHGASLEMMWQLNAVQLGVPVVRRDDVWFCRHGQPSDCPQDIVDQHMATTTVEERAEAAAMRETEPSEGGSKDFLAQLPAVEIDEGVFKYVLVEAKVGDATRYLVRGNSAAQYHKDVARQLVSLLNDNGVQYKVLGGGRINHDPRAGRTKIYGFSYGFPWAGEPRHDLTAAEVKRAFPTHEVEVSNEGY